jgi:hypothetical protein
MFPDAAVTPRVLARRLAYPNLMSTAFRILLLAFIIPGLMRAAEPASIRVWEKHEVRLTAASTYQNPYTEVTVWVDLVGPSFHKRIYGFWDGGQTFRVRLVATAPGRWTWTSGSQPADAGLDGKTGTFTATDWSEAEKHENPLRHGFLRATPNGHALQYADGTPYFAIGDTWYSAGTNRFKWYDDDTPRPIGPSAGFKDYVRYRKAQGYNWVNIIAAFPNWKTDDQPWHLMMDDPEHTTVRSAWVEFGSGTPATNGVGSAKNMDNEGGRPFLFPGKVPGYENYFPDMDRINPEYFKYVDRKIDYLNANGFVPFIEASRRDSGLLWNKYYGWPESYARYIEYIWARYHANNVVLSPVHLDIIDETVSPDDYSNAIRLVERKYGLPPFGTLLSANANPSTLENWGEHSWVTLNQTGNMREHENFWYLTEIYALKQPTPALNGEPYYAGYKDNRGAGAANYKLGADGGTERDNEFVRACAYGSFLSGGFAGHVYGAEGIWGADIEPSAPTPMWDAFQWASGAQMQYLRTFALSIGRRYQELEPLAELVTPNKSGPALGYEGWAYCARTPDQQVFLAYFERGCPPAKVRGARLSSLYSAQWFDPRTGRWSERVEVQANKIGIIALPQFPGDGDWGLKLTYAGRWLTPKLFP